MENVVSESVCVAACLPSCMSGEGRYSLRRIGAAEFIPSFWNTDMIPGRMFLLSALCVAELPKCPSWHGADAVLCSWLFPVAQGCSTVPDVPQCSPVSRAPELCSRPVPSKDKLQCSPGLMSGQSNCGEAPNYTAGKQGSLESGWGLINVHSSLIYAYKGLLEWSCHAGFDNANSIHSASCCSVVVVCVAACRIMVLLWECYVP